MHSPAEEIKARLSAEQVARHYGLEPNRAGFVRCPFHGERTASLKLYPGNRGWHCFGCHRGGSAINLVMELFGVSFAQAIVRINEDFRLGLAPSRKSPAERSQILEQRRAEREAAERERREYMEQAYAHRYWHEVQLHFAPTREEWETGWVHPLYLEALRLLPPLEDWLEEHLRR